MKIQEFEIEFNKLITAFGATTPDKKARIYFEELEKIPGPIFSMICRKIIRDTDRFPTISVILRAADSLNPASNSSATQFQKCTHCDGYGWVLYDGFAFRGRCEHGNKLSAKIPYNPITEIDKFNWKTVKEREEKKLYNAF